MKWVTWGTMPRTLMSADDVALLPHTGVARGRSPCPRRPRRPDLPAARTLHHRAHGERHLDPGLSHALRRHGSLLVATDRPAALQVHLQGYRISLPTK
jgi:hypothetical protein